MKTLATHLTMVLGERQFRTNIRSLMKVLGFLALVILLYSVLFHVVMDQVEDRQFTWITGFYWTLTVMSTLGFGDITFDSDLGRLFSILVLVSGVVLLLIVLPFTFIRFFYAPWLEAQSRIRAPRILPDDVRNPVVLCSWDSIAPDLVSRLEDHHIPCVVLEEDPERAARMKEEGIRVVTGEVESRTTYENVRAWDARLVVANRDDVSNTNIALTVREVAPDVPIAAIASHDDSVDILELAGSTHVIPLRRQLGEQLANRVNAGHAQTHVVGAFENLVIAEFPVLNTPLVGKTVRMTRLREILGVSIVAVWEQARLVPAHPDTVLTELSLPVVVGTPGQMQELDELLYIYDTNYHPVLVVGGGTVGTAAARSLRRRGIQVHLIERNEALQDSLAGVADLLFLGDAANRELLEKAGLQEAPAVLLTTNDDGMNIYLAVYCRRLRPDLRIVSRITHERNMESIQRAGADLALSYSGLGVQTLLSTVLGEELVILGEGVEMHREPVPPSLAGKTLAESRIGADTGLTVVAVREAGQIITNPGASHTLAKGAELLMMGSVEQLRLFHQAMH
jgi:voltage-gated potassium channel